MTKVKTLVHAIYDTPSRFLQPIYWLSEALFRPYWLIGTDVHPVPKYVHTDNVDHCSRGTRRLRASETRRQAASGGNTAARRTGAAIPSRHANSRPRTVG
jgi:hypothetical protein